MSRKRCNRKHYALGNPIALAISGATITSESDLDKLRLRELAAIETFAKGVAQPEDFRVLCDLVNLTETFCIDGVGRDERVIQKTINKVRSAHRDVKVLI